MTPTIAERIRQLPDEALYRAVAVEVFGWFESESGKSWWRGDHWTPRKPYWAYDAEELRGYIVRLGYHLRLAFIGDDVVVQLWQPGAHEWAQSEHQNYPRALAEAALLWSRGGSGWPAGVPEPWRL